MGGAEGQAITERIITLLKRQQIYKKKKESPCAWEANASCGYLWMVGFRQLIISFLLTSSF